MTEDADTIGAFDDVPLRSLLEEARQCLVARLREEEEEKAKRGRRIRDDNDGDVHRGSSRGGISVSTANQALDVFLAEANAVAFERILAHMCSYRDMVRRHLFAPRARVSALRTDMTDTLADIHESGKAGADDGGDDTGDENNNNNDDDNDLLRLGASAEEGDVDGAAALAHLRSQRQLRCVDDTLRSLIDEMEHGFERLRARLEDRLLEPSAPADDAGMIGGGDREEEEEALFDDIRDADDDDDDNGEGGGGGRGRGGDDLMLATTTAAAGALRSRAPHADRLLTDRAVRRLISTVAFRTHNLPQRSSLSSSSSPLAPQQHPPRRTTTPSAELRRVAFARFDRICVRFPSSDGRGRKMLALHRFLVDLGRLIEEDYQRNKYNPDVQDVRAFRVTRLVEFLDDDSERTADDMTDVPRNDMHAMI